MTIFSLTPGLIYIVGGLLSLFCRGWVNKLVVLSVPVLAFIQLVLLTPLDNYIVEFLMSNLDLLRVDKLSLVFGYVFVISSFFAFIYGLTTAKKTEFSSALIYVGSAISVVFARDLITMYIFWEFMALSSVFLVLLRGTDKSRKASLRYIIVHIVGGLVLLAGIILHIHQTGSITFSHFTTQNMSTWLMLIGVLVNAAAIPFSSWLPDAYPESTVMGGVILSAYTSKTAVYALLRGFPGWDILIWVGVAMSIYGIIYALLENDVRRVLAYSIINQAGFMVCGAGIGTPLAIAGVSAHAFCCLIYKSLLWMSAGTVLHRTGKSKLTELGGLYQTMPWTFVFGLIGALSIAAAPITSGFVSKTITLKAVELQHLFWPWIFLEVASAGVVFHAGIKFPYFVFFSKDRGLRPKEANKPMLIGMAALSFLCIYLGFFPGQLYAILPYTEHVLKTMPATFSGIYIKHFDHVVTQMQILSFSALVFFVFLPLLKRTDTISIDFDWVYRRLLRYVYIFSISFIDFVYQAVNNMGMSAVQSLSSFFKQSIPKFFFLLNLPYLRFSKVSVNEKKLLADYTKTVKHQAIPFTVIGALVFVLFILIYFLV